jgi:hypothetical protein
MDFDSAFAAIEAASVDNLPPVCLEIPADLFLRSPDLCYQAVAKNPLCYCSLPIAIKQDEWGLVDLAADILGKSNARSPELLHPILESMPPIMRDCFLFFLQNPPEWLKSSQKQIRLSYFRYHYELPVEPNVSDEQAAKWVDAYFEFGYAMVPHKEKHPELLDIIVRSHYEMHNLKMIPESVIKSNIDYVRTLLKSGPPSLIENIPENLRDEDMCRYTIDNIIANNRHASKLLRLIPDAFWDANPELLVDIIDADPLNYKELPLSVREHHAGLAAEQAVSSSPNFYAHIIPESVKEGNWGLAWLAVSLDPDLYSSVPLDMRDFELNGDERVLDLAQLASKIRRRAAKDFDSMEAYREYAIARSLNVSKPNMGFEHMSAGTRDALLRRLYITGEHSHLRDLHKFREARAKVGIAHSKTKSSVKNMGLFKGLSQDNRDHVFSFVPAANKRAADHAAWCMSELQLLQEHTDRLLYQFHLDEDADAISTSIAFVGHLVTYFCDSRYAWSVVETELPRDDSILDIHLAQTVARAIWQWFGVVQAVSDKWQSTYHYPLDTQSEPELEEVRVRLEHLGFPPPAKLISATVKRYLKEPLVYADGTLTDIKLFSEYTASSS